MAQRWRHVRLAEIPSDDALPPPADGVTDEERDAARAELRDDERAHVDLPDYPPVRPAWHAIRPFLGISAFGIAATEARAGEALIWPHTEETYGHEEVYVVLEGRARFLCDGEELELAHGEVLYVEPPVARGAIALETPTVLLIVGGTPGSYEPPVWARDWRPPETWLQRHRS
jgi:mannose-6-phosphate isomerase-like protein (cupin superfamily)